MLNCNHETHALSHLNLQWVPLSTKTDPSNGGDLDPHVTHNAPAHVRPQPKRHLDRFSHVCTDDCGVSLNFTVVCLFPRSKLPVPMLASGPHVILKILKKLLTVYLMLY